MKNVNARFANDKYVLLSELGSKLNLRFSSHLAVGNKLIALDGIKKILLVLEANNELTQPYIIELNKVAAISIKKSYGSIVSGELKTKRFEEFLKRIDLQFEYTGKKEAFILSFYNSEIDNLRNLPGLERNAKNWQMILSKMVVSRADKIIKDRNKLSLV